MTGKPTLALLGVALLGHLFLLASSPQGGERLIERIAVGMLGPLTYSAGVMTDRVTGFFESFRTRRSLESENQRLSGEVARLQRDLVRLQGVEDELGRLSRLTGYERPTPGQGLVADVIYVDDASWLRTLVIYTGSSSARLNQPVVTAEGLVGRVVVAAGHYAKVQMVTDRSAAVSAMLRRTRRKGVAQGRGGEEGLALRYVPRQADVAVGDTVVTAGLDGVFPRGIPIGVVAAVGEADGLFRQVDVVPAVDFSLLDQVFVLNQTHPARRGQGSTRPCGSLSSPQA